jgi:hypothetical protein
MQHADAGGRSIVTLAALRVRDASDIWEDVRARGDQILVTQRYGDAGCLMARWHAGHESLNLVAQIAVLPNDAALGGLVLIIVTSETPGSVSVSHVVLMRAPRHVHHRKHVAGMQELRGRDELIDVAPARLRVRGRGRAVKRA